MGNYHGFGFETLFTSESNSRQSNMGRNGSEISPYSKIKRNESKNFYKYNKTENFIGFIYDLVIHVLKKSFTLSKL